MTHYDTRLVLLSSDHEVIGTAAAQLDGLLAGGDVAGARQRFGTFTTALEAHMVAEERGIFAALGAMEEFAPTIERLVAEHDQARRAIAGASSEADDGAWADIVGALLKAFALHELEEESDLYPAAEVALPLP